MFSGIASQTKSRQFSISRGRGRVSISRVRGSFLGVHLGLGVGLGFGLGPGTRLGGHDVYNALYNLLSKE